MIAMALTIYPIGVYIFKQDIPHGGMRLMDDEVSDMSDNKCPHCSGKSKHRGDKEKKDLMNRLKRIEGQVRGVENMLENDTYCTDILVQVSAINAALNSFNKRLLESHIKSCVADDIRQGNDDVIEELVDTLGKLMK